MTNISRSPYDFNQETDNESWNFEHINDIRDSQLEDRGDDFDIELELIPLTNYFGHDRIIVISHGAETPLSTLPTSMTDEWWPLVTDCFTRKQSVEVNGRIWTSPELKEFYASVKIALPTIEEAEQEVRDDNFLDDEAEGGVYVFRTPSNFSNELIDYINPAWRKAHGMTKEQYDAEVEKTRQNLERMKAKQSSPYDQATAEPTAQAKRKDQEQEMLKNARAAFQDVGNPNRTPAVQEYESSRKKGIVAWLLWLFLGVLGAHRFYLGNTGYAIAMLLCGWMTLGIWPLLDGIICINPNLKKQNRELWDRIAAKYGINPTPAPESAI